MKIRPSFVRLVLVVLNGMILSITSPGMAWAARPFVTDDARLTTAGSCQLESWTRLYRDSAELWALPACNPGGNLEFTMGGGRIDRPQAEMQMGRDTVFQAKTLLRPLRTDSWGLGLAVGMVQHAAVNARSNLLGETYMYLPYSASFAGDRLITHLNLGWLHDKASGKDHTTWGAGMEFNATARWMLVGESFGNDQDQSFWQGGARYAIVPNLLQVDMTVGGSWRRHAGGDWISFGLRFTPAKLF